MKRVITAAVLILIAAPILWFSDTIAFPAAAAVLSAIGAYEILSVAKLHKKLYISVPSIAFAAFIPYISGTDSRALASPRFFVAVIFAFFLYLLFIGVICYGKTDMGEIAFAFFGVFLVAISFFALVACRINAKRDYLLIFIAACMTDIFALYGGTLFGKHKLCPQISPKKTVEGAVSGIIGSIFGFLLYGLACSVLADESVNWLFLILFAIPASIAGQFGDLTASAIKRKYAVKDFGTLFPGHGGVLDRFDSIMALSLCCCTFILIRGIIL